MGPVRLGSCGAVRAHVLVRGGDVLMAVEKALLYPDGRQKHAHLGLVDSRGCFLLMLDGNEVQRFEFSSEADLIGMLAAKQEADEARCLVAVSLVRDMFADLDPDIRYRYAGRMERIGIAVPDVGASS